MNSFNGINHIHGSLRISFALFRSRLCGLRIIFPPDNRDFYQKRFILAQISGLFGV